MKWHLRALVAAVAAAGITSAASAGTVLYDDGAGHTASATFTVSGDVLTVTLTNTSSQDVLVPQDILEAVLWNNSLTHNTLVGTSVTLGGTSKIYNNGVQIIDT